MTSKHAGGRPAQIDLSLLTRRDDLIRALSFGWEIGWELACSRTPEQLRRAFQPVAVGADEELFRLFVRGSTIEAFGKDIRSTESQKAGPAKRMYEILVPLQDSGRNLQQIRDAISIQARNENQQSPELMKEYFHRWSRHKELQNEMNQLDEALCTLENRLADQQAFFAQKELLKFIGDDKYAHTPRNLAYAMAGLPRIGCWHSFQVCEKSPSPFWPKGEQEKWPIYYRVFKLIENCWDQQRRDQSQTLMDLLLGRIKAVPQSEFLGQHLRNNWRFIRQAIGETDLTELPSQVVPYRVLGKLKEIVGGPRSVQENQLAARDAREAFE